MEVRRDDSQGAVLFSGTLGKGKMKKFKGKDLWINLGAPQNVRLEVQGKKVALKGDVGPWGVAITNGHVVQGANVQG